MLTTIEYGVLHAEPGAATPEVVPVGGAELMRQEVAELREAGHRADPVTRLITDWQVCRVNQDLLRRTHLREQVAALAFEIWENEHAGGVVAKAWEKLTRLNPEMGERDRAYALNHLLDEVARREAFADTDPGDATHTEFDTNLDATVADAADALIGAR